MAEKQISAEELDLAMNQAVKNYHHEIPEIQKLWDSEDDYFSAAMDYYFRNNRLPELGFKPETKP